MKIEDTRLVVAALSGTPCIATINKREKSVMNQKREIPTGEFVKAIIEWLEAAYKPDDVVELKRSGKVVYEISRVKLSPSKTVSGRQP